MRNARFRSIKIKINKSSCQPVFVNVFMLSGVVLVFLLRTFRVCAQKITYLTWTLKSQRLNVTHGSINDIFLLMTDLSPFRINENKFIKSHACIIEELTLQCSLARTSTLQTIYCDYVTE